MSHADAIINFHYDLISRSRLNILREIPEKASSKPIENQPKGRINEKWVQTERERDRERKCEEPRKGGRGRERASDPSQSPDVCAQWSVARAHMRSRGIKAAGQRATRSDVRAWLMTGSSSPWFFRRLMPSELVLASADRLLGDDGPVFFRPGQGQESVVSMMGLQISAGDRARVDVRTGERRASLPRVRNY